LQFRSFWLVGGLFYRGVALLGSAVRGGNEAVVMQGFEVAVKEFLASIGAFTRAFAEAQVPVGVLVRLMLFEKGFSSAASALRSCWARWHLPLQCSCGRAWFTQYRSVMRALCS